MGQTDSKLLFRQKVLVLVEQQQHQQNDDVTALDPAQAEFWTGFFELTESLDDVCSLLTAQDVRHLRDKCTETLRLFIEQVAERLFREVDSAESTNKKALLNCLRILTRLLPFLFEADIDTQLLWNDDEIAASPNADRSLAERLLLTLTHLLFFEGFTLPVDALTADDSADEPDQDSRYVIWEQGIGASSAPSSSADLDQCRLEVLRLILVLLSRSMYYSPGDSAENLYARFIVCSLDKNLVLAMLCSLLNVVISYNPASWIPYNHVVWGDSREPLVHAAIHVLTALFDYNHQLDSLASNSMLDSPSVGDRSPVDRTGAIYSALRAQHKQALLSNTNQFRYYVSRLHRSEDFRLLLDALTLHISNPIHANNVYLPNSRKQVGFSEEAIMLFWKLIDINSRFMDFAVKDEQILEIVGSLLHQSLNFAKETAKIGYLRMTACILHTLSGSREFAVILNRAYNGVMHGDLPRFHGCYADYLILAFYTIIFANKGRLSLNDGFLTIVANISPYVKDLSIVTANKLLQMFVAFSSVPFLFSNAANHGLIFFLLDTFNNIVQYQFDGNPHLVYELIRHKNRFHELRDVTFEKGMDELEKLRSKRKEGSVDNLAEDSLSQSTQFVPTKDWFIYWHKQLPLQTILSLVDTVSPEIEKRCTEEGLTDEGVIEYLQSGTLVGLLPQPHAIFVRKFQQSDTLRIWFSSYLWGTIYLQYAMDMPNIWVGTELKLFLVKIDESE